MSNDIFERIERALQYAIDALAAFSERLQSLESRLRIVEEFLANYKTTEVHRLVDRNADSNDEQERTVGGPDHV